MTCSPEAKRKPNKGMELTASSVRSCLAPASGISSCLAVRAGVGNRLALNDSISPHRR